MVSTVGTRPSHYEMLGIEPTATVEEITRAFAREMSMFRPRSMGGVAELSIAYETLRDPAKRRAYDASLRPKPEPQPKRQEWAPFMIRASAHSAGRPVVDPLHRPARQPEPQPRPDPPVDPRLAAIAVSLRELAKPGAFGGSSAPAREPEPAPPPQADTKPALEPRAGGDRALNRDDELHFGEVEAGPIEWKRTGMTVGVAILAVGLLGGVLGSWSGSAIDEPPQAKPATTIALPPVRARASAAATLPAPALRMAEVRTERRSRNTVAVHGSKRVATLQRGLSEKELEELPPVDVSHRTSDGAAGATAQTIAETPPVLVTPAKLPLSNATIARTIGRIGYACGQVASATAVEGETPGVFKVTCTSGHSYRAAPVRGRYHFRRLGGR